MKSCETAETRYQRQGIIINSCHKDHRGKNKINMEFHSKEGLGLSSTDMYEQLNLCYWFLPRERRIIDELHFGLDIIREDVKSTRS